MYSVIALIVLGVLFTVICLYLTRLSYLMFVGVKEKSDEVNKQFDDVKERLALLERTAGFLIITSNNIVSEIDLIKTELKKGPKVTGPEDKTIIN